MNHNSIEKKIEKTLKCFIKLVKIFEIYIYGQYSNNILDFKLFHNHLMALLDCSLRKETSSSYLQTFLENL